jgi:hypothetical protein
MLSCKAHHLMRAAVFIQLCLFVPGAAASVEVDALNTDVDIQPTEQFTVVLDQTVDSKDACIGDQVSAHLGSALTIDGERFPPGTAVIGQVTEVDKARRHIKAELPSKRWLHSDGGLGLEFEAVLDQYGTPTPICSVPVPMPRDFCAAVKEKSLAVGKQGIVEPSRRSELLPKATRTAIGAAGTILRSPFVPLVGGLIGAAAPSLVLESCDKEYQSQIKHRRLKGFATGAIAGMPGGFLINDTLMKGRDAMLRPGTVLLVRLAPVSKNI